MNRQEVEILKVPWYELPLVRVVCPRCAEHSAWSGEFAALIYWELCHACK